jgi:hypothetical protein
MNDNLLHICKIGQGADCCKYLLVGSGGFECAKAEGYKKMVDDNWNEHKSAQGDNCDGIIKEVLREHDDRYKKENL